ncbi:MAG: pseudouridine synthase [Tepidisphaeraceae bacterium]|jgi:23S rRNA pseudouridine2605 synthase
MPRIQKVLAGAGVASRRSVERMIREGRVALNGKIVQDLPILVDPEVDSVQVDGEPVDISSDRGGPRLYILLNKPKHVYSTNVAQGEQTLAIDLLPPNLPGRVFPVGRLDADSKGLLLLTNDGEMTNRLTHPRYGVPKTYRAVVDGYIDPRKMQALSKSIWLSDGSSALGPKTKSKTKTVHSHLKVVKRSRDMTVLDITIREGRSRQIRRILMKFGHKVRDLTRIAMGPLTLQGLSPGQFRHLTNREVSQLRALTQREV